MTQRIDPPKTILPEHSASRYALATIAAGLAHDINNPLNSISTNAELALLLAQRSNEPAPEILRRIIEDCRRCAAVVQQMVQATCGADDPAPVDLATVLAAARSQVLEMFNLAPDAIALPADMGRFEVSGEAAALTRAVAELLVNAVAAGAKLISMGLTPGSAQVALEISDNGEGIPPALAARLLKSFHSPREKGPGVGLGLGIARRIAVDHGGKLELRRAEKGRTTFALTLPLLQA